ncbi:MAG TPA: hypothetical protein VI259_18580 [Gemmatimonadaceae bacterium]
MTSTGSGGASQRDAMICRWCGNEERASEGYPCAECGTFLCVHCDMRGIVRCRACEAKRQGAPAAIAPAAPKATQ